MPIKQKIDLSTPYGQALIRAETQRDQHRIVF